MSINIQSLSCKNFEYDESGLGRMGYGCKVCLNYKGHSLLGDCPSFAYSAKLHKDEKSLLEKYIEKGKNIAENKHAIDGKSHRISVLFSEWTEYLFGHKLHNQRWLTLIVDDMREAGGKCGVGNTLFLADFTWPKIQQNPPQNT